MKTFYFVLFFLLSASVVFCADKPISRAQFARLLNESSLLSELPDVASLERFSDLPITHPNLGAIVACVKKGILEGFPGGTFKPEGIITRYELAIILDKLVTAIEKLYGASFHSFETNVSISDVPKDHWAYPQVQKLTQYHIVALDSGGSFRGKSPATALEVEQYLTQLKKQTILLKDAKAEKKKEDKKEKTKEIACNKALLDAFLEICRTKDVNGLIKHIPDDIGVNVGRKPKQEVVNALTSKADSYLKNVFFEIIPSLSHKISLGDKNCVVTTSQDSSSNYYYDIYFLFKDKEWFIYSIAERDPADEIDFPSLD